MADRFNTDYASRYAGGAQANAAQRISDVAQDGEVGSLKRLASAARRIPGAGLAEKALNSPVTKFAGKAYKPLAVGEGILAAANTSGEEAEKLADMKLYHPQDGDSAITRGLGEAKNAFIHTLPAAYNTMENFGGIWAVDAIPGVHMPRMEGGKFIPADQVHSFDLADVGPGIAKLARGANNLYREAAGYDMPAQDEQGAAGKNQAAKQAPNAGTPASTQGDPQPMPTPAPAPAPAAGQASIVDGITQSTGAHGEPMFSGSNPAAASAQPAPAQSISAEQRADQQAEAQMREAQFGQMRLANRRQGEMDNRARGLSTERLQAISDIKNSIAYRFSGRTKEDHAEHQQAIANLMALTGSPVQNQNAPGTNAPNGQIDPAGREGERQAAIAQQLKNEDEKRQQQIKQRIADLMKTDPDAAQSLALHYQNVMNPGDRYVKGQVLQTQGPDGQPLVDPKALDVTYDTQSGRQYGGMSGQQPSSQQGPSPVGGLSKEQYIDRVMSDQRAKAAGITRADAAAKYDQLTKGG